MLSYAQLMPAHRYKHPQSPASTAGDLICACLMIGALFALAIWQHHAHKPRPVTRAETPAYCAVQAGEGEFEMTQYNELWPAGFVAPCKWFKREVAV